MSNMSHQKCSLHIQERNVIAILAPFIAYPLVSTGDYNVSIWMKP
jgi:hypothetical protein